LRAYVDDREDWINAVCADVAVSFKQVKNAVLISMHGGNYEQVVENKAHDKLTRFAAEVKQLAADFSKLTEFKELWEKAEVVAKSKAEEKSRASGRRDERANPRGTFISWICQIQEAKIIGAVKAYFEEEPQNLQVGCVVFDGLMPYWEGADSVPEELLQGASDRAFKETGIRVEFVQKSLKPRPEDLAAAGTTTTTPQLMFSDAEDIALEAMPDRGDGSGEKAMRPFEFPPGVRLLGIIAAMGLGKTHTAVAFLDGFLKKHPKARILFISNRRQQSHTFMSFLKALGFQHYIDTEGGLGKITGLLCSSRAWAAWLWASARGPEVR
jgi:hypothetical protein